jgi:hypothetical protein
MTAIQIKTKPWIVAVALFVSLLSACTHVYDVPTAPVSAFQQADQIDLAVGLRLTEELHTAKWETSRLGDTFRIPLGDALVSNAKALTSGLFTRVVTFEGATPPTDTKFDAILTPRFVLAERTMGATAFGTSIFTVILEWKLEDTKGNILWIDTLKGEGRGKTGNVFTHKGNAEKQIKIALEELFQSSFKALSSSPEIRTYATAPRS